MNDAGTVTRKVDRVNSKTWRGPDSQVDNKAMIIAPGDFLNTEPFLVLGENWFSSPGFEWHPHRGFETVTMVLDGVLEHGDSLGNTGTLEPGDLQWMTAGSGILHRELAFRNEHAHILQLWVNLPKNEKMTATRYQDLRARDHALVDHPGVKVQVISGTSDGVTGPAANHWPIIGMLITLDPNITYAVRLPAQDRAFAYAMEGAAAIGGRNVQEGEVAWSDPVRSMYGSSLELQTRDGDNRTKVLLFSGEPIGEPIYAGGPFVMTSREEIEKAFYDLHSGKFGPIPRAARLLTR